MNKSGKLVVFWVGNGNNEPAWAKAISSHNSVLLFQRSLLTQQYSVWENGQQIFLSPEKRIGWQFLDRVFFGFFSTFGLLRLTFSLARGKKIDLLVVEGARGLTGVFLKWVGLVKAVVSVHNDFLPSIGSPAVRLHRRINTILSNLAARNSDEVWRLSPRIPIGKNHPNNYVVPVFINENKNAGQKLDSIMYVGFPSKDHALEILFEIAGRHRIPLEIIGESAYLNSIRPAAPAQTTFHGYITDPDRIAEIIARCFCGYAVYLNTGSQSYSYYGFASKTFHYLSNNVPVVTTSTSFFSEIIESKGIGHVVAPEADAIEKAILDIKNRFEEFSSHINTFRQEWNSQAVRFFDERMAVLLRG